MTLILKLDLDIVKMYHHTKMPTGSKVIAQTDKHINTQTDRQTHTHTHTMKTLPLPHMWEVKTRPRKVKKYFYRSGKSYKNISWEITDYLVTVISGKETTKGEVLILIRVN